MCRCVTYNRQHTKDTCKTRVENRKIYPKKFGMETILKPIKIFCGLKCNFKKAHKKYKLNIICPNLNTLFWIFFFLVWLLHSPGPIILCRVTLKHILLMPFYLFSAYAFLSLFSASTFFPLLCNNIKCVLISFCLPTLFTIV